MNPFQIVHDFYANGSLDEEQYQLWAGFAVAIVAPKGMRRWWEEENGRLGFHSDIREWINSRLQDPENPMLPIAAMLSQFGGSAWESARPKGDA